MSSSRIVIIGAGHAGVRAALSAREAGHEGPLTMIANEGIDLPYERPLLSKWSPERSLFRPIAPDHHFEDAGINRINASVSSINREAHEVIIDDGTSQPYSRLLLATGASARRLDTGLTKGASIHYLRNLNDAVRIRKTADRAASAIIIGGGFLGLELAASLRGMGVEVQVLESANRLLARAVTEPVAALVQSLHENHGVKFYFGIKLKSLTSGAVILDDGRTLSADLIIAGVGSTPNTKLAQDAGLALENGIKVNTHLQTTDPDIFAAGDCCSFPLYGEDGVMARLESWQAAGEQGALVGRNMLNHQRASCALIPWFWSEQYDHVLQVSGLPDTTTESVERVYADNHHVSFGINEDDTLAFASGIAPSTKVAKDIRFASKMIEAGTLVDKAQLGDATIALKSLLHRKQLS